MARAASRLLLLSAVLFSAVSATGRAADGAVEGSESAAAPNWPGADKLKEMLAEIKAKVAETGSHVHEKLDEMAHKSALRADERRKKSKALRAHLTSIADAQVALREAAGRRMEKAKAAWGKLHAKLDKFGASLASDQTCVAVREGESAHAQA